MSPFFTFIHDLLIFRYRNSAPEIVVTREGLPRQPLSVPTVPSGSPGHRASASRSNRIEERINRARARVWHNNSQNSVGSNSSGHITSSASVNSISAQASAQVIPSSSPTTTTAASAAAAAAGSSSTTRQKLSTRFHSAQKLNYKLAALSNFASSATGTAHSLTFSFLK